MRIFILFIVILFAANLFAISGEYSTDTRIRTFIYGPNEVFPIYTEFGYQSHIELQKDEKIKTISVGNTAAFKITPVENRIFIKPLQVKRNTNLTVITNKRSYQFDISSNPVNLNKVVYVARFYYPDKDERIVSRASNFGNLSTASGGGFSAIPRKGPQMSMPINYDYTMSGAASFSPSKIFDDGKSTYFKFDPTAQKPIIYSIDARGYEQPVTTRSEGKYIIVDQISHQFSLRKNDEILCIFNESKLMGN